MLDNKILIVDDNLGALSALKMFLQFEFKHIKTISNPNMLNSLVPRGEFDVVLLDMNFSAGVNSGNEGLFWLSEIKKLSPNTEVIMITAFGDVELAVKALKLGAADFVLKPWENEKLLATLKAACNLSKSKKEVNKLTKKENSLKDEINKTRSNFIGESKAIKRVKSMITKVAKTDANILITGENGTGKEIVAIEIHNQSERSTEILVTVDMGAIAETLFESELFGHKKGAFTDARTDRVGKFELADKGSLFFDEIGNLPLAMQSKLLAVLQNRKIVQVGANRETPIDIRLISATNSNLDELVEKHGFREDLLYRLNTIRIELPPLRDRGDDIELLATHFLKLYEKKYKQENLILSDKAINKLNNYNWPGNVRELQHSIEKAVILSESNTIEADDFNFKNSATTITQDDTTLENMEKQMIEAALYKHCGNYSAAAQQLGITRQTIYNKIKKYGL